MTAPIRGRAGWWSSTKVPTPTRRPLWSRPTSGTTQAGPPRKRRRCTWSRRTITTSAPSDRCPCLSGVTLQEFQGALVEFLGVLVDGSVRAIVEDDELGIRYPFGDQGRKPDVGDQVMPADSAHDGRLH